MPQDVITDSFNKMGAEIIKYIIIAGILALPFAWLNEKLKKKEKEKEARKEEERIQRAIQKALNEDRKK